MIQKDLLVLGYSEIGVIVAAASATAVLALLYVDRAQLGRRRAGAPQAEPLALLFEDGVLHHATDSAMAELALAPGTHLWDDMRETLLDRFPNFPTAAGTGDSGSLTLAAYDGRDPGEIRINWRGPLCWVTLLRGTRREAAATVDPAVQRAVETAPYPIWQTDAAGYVTWHSPAYAKLYREIYGRAPQAGECLFGNPDPLAENRVALRRGSQRGQQWFEVFNHSVKGVTIHHAISIDALVEAEDAQRNFVQTLAMTFAHLPVGLAIFDRDTRLALFNPALLNLTDLPAEFLSRRPSMTSFFDQLRENRRMPEPKNYRDWRQAIAALIAAASDGTFQETWSLEDGRTYSVQGRPHPDGATAFLIEDISAEISLTRNFRAELELGQTLLDRVEDGFAVFSTSGILTFCNAVYRDLWGQNPESAFADVTIDDCIDLWREKSQADGPWQQIADQVSSYGDRPVVRLQLTQPDGGVISCVAEPIASGGTLVRFRPHEAKVLPSSEVSSCGPDSAG